METGKILEERHLHGREAFIFDVDANEEGCAGYKINVLSLLKSRQMTRDTLF